MTKILFKNTPGLLASPNSSQNGRTKHYGVLGSFLICCMAAFVLSITSCGTEQIIDPIPFEDKPKSDPIIKTEPEPIIYDYEPVLDTNLSYGTSQGINVVNDTLYISISYSNSGLLELNDNFEVVRFLKFEKDGVEIINHPVGIAYKEGYPTYIGCAGGWLEINWDQFLEDGNLDNSIAEKTIDPFTYKYGRVAYVTYEGRILLANTDYVKRDLAQNLLILYDPFTLELVDTIAIPSFVQSINWIDNMLIMAGNITSYSGWLIHTLDLDTLELDTEDLEDNSELEGFVIHNEERLFVTDKTLYREYEKNEDQL